MSLEGVVLGAARVAKTATGVKGAYALAGDRANGILPYPSDVPDGPVVLVAHDRFELDPGSWEKVRHFLAVDLWVRAASPETAEVETMRVAWAIVAAFRTHTNLFGVLDATGAAGYAVVVGGGPMRPEDVNGQPFVVYPMTLRAVQATPQTYSGG